MKYVNCNGCNTRILLGEDDYTEIAPDVFMCSQCHYDFNEWYQEAQEKSHEYYEHNNEIGCEGFGLNV